MSFAYMLFHDHDLGNTVVDTKLLGVYRSSLDVRQAVARFSRRQGFCEAKNGFRIETPEFGHRRFPSGFVHGDDVSRGEEGRLNGTSSSELRDVAYVVYHEYEHPACIDNIRFIGIFSTNEDAEAAVEEASESPGFSEHLDGFTIGVYTVGEDHWTDGYATVR